jgi:hypothetical protein
MTTIADNLGTTYFQLSVVGVGALAVGIEDIRQRIYNVLNSSPGTDPFRPLFGSYVYKYNDKPLDIAIPNIKKEIFSALDLWMPEIQIKTITHSINDINQLLFNITYLLVDDDLIDSVTFSNGSLSGDTGSNSIIITAFVPPKYAHGVYRVYFTVDDESALPPIPPEGFQSAVDILTWINTNWSNYGRWYLTETSLVLYLNSGIANTASLLVTETAQLTLKVLIPGLPIGSFYSLDFTANENPISPPFPDNINTREGLISWVQSNWGDYGQWSIVTEANTSGIGDYSNIDYNDDYDNGNITSVLSYLVFQSEEYLTATLTFN